MSLTTLLNRTATITRLQASTGIKSTYVTINTYPCAIQPLSAERSLQEGFAFGRGFQGYFEITADIKIGDKVVDNSGRLFQIAGIRKHDYGTNQHLAVSLVQEQGAGQ